jgi:hypothetical protein
MKKPPRGGFFMGVTRLGRGSLAWAVEPIGQHEQAENHEHDDEDVFDFHGESLSGGSGEGFKGD